MRERERERERERNSFKGLKLCLEEGSEEEFLSKDYPSS
jgi:hypothetical protein